MQLQEKVGGWLVLFLFKGKGNEGFCTAFVGVMYLNGRNNWLVWLFIFLIFARNYMQCT